MELDLTADFRTITELAAPHEPGVPAHCLRCQNDLYFVQCGIEDHFRCFACNMCVEPDWILGQVPLHHTATGSGPAWSFPADWPGDAPPDGCSPGVMPSREESTSKIAGALEDVIEERYGDNSEG